MSLYVGDSLVCRFGWNSNSIQMEEFHPNLHTRRSPT